MNPECIREVEAAIGRALKPAEAQGMEDRIVGNLRQLARSDASWGRSSGAERLQKAADLARQQTLDSANKQAQRRASNLIAQARESQRLIGRAEQIAGAEPHHKALFERLRQVDDYATGVRNELLSEMVPALNAIEPRLLGLLEDTAYLRDFVRAVLGDTDVPPVMAKAAKVYSDVMEKTRLRLNSLGADIGKLEYGYLPQTHDVGRIARAGKGTWVESVFGKLDRERYLTADGLQMDDAQLREMLGDVFDTISTEGRNKRIAGAARGNSSRAARFDEKHRALHFRDADSFLAYNSEFGRGSTMAAIYGHVGQAAKNIGMMEELGANPNATFRLLKDLAEQRDNVQGAREWGATADMVWDTLNGTLSQPVTPWLASVGQGFRNYTTAAMLQSVTLSAVTDVPLQMLNARFNKIPMGENLVKMITSFGGNAKADARRLGLGMDEIAGEMARWHTDHMTQNWTSKLANTTMKLTLIEAWSNGLRRATGLQLAGALDTMRRQAWNDLSEFDLARMRTAGVTEADWKVWQLAKTTDVSGVPMLTKEGLAEIPDSVLVAAGLDPVRDVNRATARLLGFIDREAHMAVLTPDILTRAAMTQGTKSGTWGGEIARTLLLFKSFGFAMVQKHLRRINSIPSGAGKAAYSAALLTTLPLFGALAIQLKDLRDGKDPRDMTTGKFWAAAAAQGGGFGIFGDMLYTGLGGNGRGGQANWTSLAGPGFGNIADFLNVTLGNAKDAWNGKPTNAGDELIRFTKKNTPFINLWYLRTAINRLFMDDLQEQVRPGSKQRMQTYARNEWGQQFWWAPGEALPERAPDFEEAIGE